MGHYPYVSLLLPFLVGILAGHGLDVRPAWFNGIYAGAIISLIAIGVLYSLRDRFRRSNAAFLGWMVSLFLAQLGFLLVQNAHPEINLQHFSHYESTHLYGQVGDEPHFRENRVRFSFRVLGAMHGDTLRSRSGKINMTLQLADVESDDDWDQLFQYGRMLIVPAAFNKVPNPRNPGELDYAAHLEKNDCWHQSYIPVEQVGFLSLNQGNIFMRWAIDLRKQLVQKFNTYLDDEHAQAIASTLILGYRADLSQEILQIYSATGTIHVLSVSGMHVVIVFWLLSLMLSWMDRGPLLKRMKFPLLLVFIWGYALITGFSPSVLRAAVMLSFVIWANEVGKQARIYNSIAASAFIILLFQPKFLLNIGFQLSYLAVIFIVYLQPILKEWSITRVKWLKPIADYSVMSIAAQAGAFPLATYYFNQFPLYFLLANLIIVLPATGIMYVGFALLICPPGVIASWFGFGLEWLIIAMNYALKMVLHLPYANLTGLNISFLTCVGLYFWMLSLSFSVTGRSKFLLKTSLILLFLLGVSSIYSKWTDFKTNEIVIHNVRNSLAISVKNRNKYWLITDLEQLSHSSIQYAVMPYAKRRAVESKIKLLPINVGYKEDNLYVSSKVIQYGQQRMVIWDGAVSKSESDEIFTCDRILIRNNPSVTLAEILAQYPSPEVIVDGSNYWRTVERLQKEADDLDVRLYILKDNYAYFWQLIEDNE